MNRFLFTSKEVESINNLALTKDQIDIIRKPTPKSEIEIKFDENGNPYNSVKVGYVKKQMALIFGYDFDFEIKSREYFPSTKEVLVEGRLIVRSGFKTLIREQFGGHKLNTVSTGSTIAKNQAINIADGYKAAASDAFKKCASEFGVCWDIYNQERPQQKPAEENKVSYSESKITERFKEFCKAAESIKELESVRDNYENNGHKMNDELSTVFDSYYSKLLKDSKI